MAHRHVLHPMRRHEHGRAVLIHAYQWGVILRFSGLGAARIRASGSLYVYQGSFYCMEVDGKNQG